MAQNTPKRKIKDSVFTNLFQDKKYLLQLYKALHPSREQEVVDMMMTLFDDEQILKAYTKDIARETAIKMIRKGKMSLEEIAEYVPSLSMDELKELEAEVMQLV